MEVGTVLDVYTRVVINRMILDRLDLVYSDDPEGRLGEWIPHTVDGRVRLRYLLRLPAIRDTYDVVLIDTQGATGPLQDASVTAADILLPPVRLGSIELGIFC